MTASLTMEMVPVEMCGCSFLRESTRKSMPPVEEPRE